MRASLWIVLAFFSGNIQADTNSRISDLETLRSEYVLQSQAFSESNRAQALAFIQKQIPRVGAMSPEQFLLCVTAIPGFAQNAHDMLMPGAGAWNPDARLPIRMIWFDDGWVVARAAPAYVDLLGARVLHIDGHSQDEVLHALHGLSGGTDGFRRWNLEWVVESAGMLHAAGVARAPDKIELDLQLRNGRHVQRVLPFVKSATLPPSAGPVRLWSADAWPGEAEQGWHSVEQANQPLYLQDAKRKYRVDRLPELDAVYLQMRSNLDEPDDSISEFMQHADQMLATTVPKNLVVDLRFNTGGNADFTTEWLRGLPRRVSGSVYVLISRYTFSAGIVSAAALKQGGGDKVKLVGEPVGDRLVWWSEGESVCTAGSHYCVRRSDGLWNLIDGCEHQHGCYGDKFHVNVGTLTPDLPAPLTSTAWLSGRDPALEAIRSRIHQ